MKIVISFVIGLFILNAVSAEDIEIPSQISLFLEAWNQNSLAIAEEVISPNYEIPGLPQELSSSVLNQAFAGNSSQVQIISYQGSSEHPSGIKHDLLVQRAGEERTMYFVIDSSGQICESDIFAVEVRRITQEPANAVSDYITLPFELHEDMILIEGSLNGQPAQFLLDSGAPVFVLNSHYEEGENSLSYSTASGVGGSVSSMSAKRIDHMSWPGGEFSDRDVVSMDLSALETKLERSFAGLISYAELEPYEVYVDYDARQIRLWALDESGDTISEEVLPEAQLTIPFELQAHIPIIDCKIGSLNLKMGLDTGAQSNLLDEDFMPQLMDLISNVEADTLMGADAREILIQSGEIPSLIIQNEDFGAMRYAFSDISHLSDAYQVNISGLLGKPLLSQRPFGINYRKRTLKFY